MCGAAADIALPTIVSGRHTGGRHFCAHRVIGIAMGSGVASSKAPNPNVARLRSLAAHTVFGLGLYLSGLAAAAVW